MKVTGCTWSQSHPSEDDQLRSVSLEEDGQVEHVADVALRFKDEPAALRLVLEAAIDLRRRVHGIKTPYGWTYSAESRPRSARRLAPEEERWRP